MTSLADAIAERDQILAAMDVDAAKAFVAKHGGFVPRGNVDWIKILHLARCEVTTLPDALIWESRIWLARNGAESVMLLPRYSPYLLAAMDLIFPRDTLGPYLQTEGK